MRISDWSSDVCSSDLCSESSPGLAICMEPTPISANVGRRWSRGSYRNGCKTGQPKATRERPGRQRRRGGRRGPQPPRLRISYERSEEHTSELQSLMRISYAVFCLKKKTKTTYES